MWKLNLWASGCVTGCDVDTVALTQCFVVATLASMTPAEPFLFRNYEYPADGQPSPTRPPPGSSKHEVWQAVRASSAAPYYLDDFKCGNDRYATRQNANQLASILVLRGAGFG